MLNLLIVDDESYTREGIFEMIDWTDLGISEVRQAFDGVNALEIMNDYKPNIILTDIKMPRMNGIDLAINVRELFSDCAIIFMSSYSDKIYLKSAIQLKAINYVEKPLDLEELYNSIKSASLEILKVKSLKENVENTVVLQLATETDTLVTENLLNNCFSNNFIKKLKSSYFVNVNIKFFDKISNNKQTIITSIKNIVNLHGFESLVTIKDDTYLIMHIFRDKEDFQIDFNNNLKISLSKISEYLITIAKHYICVGSIVDDVNMIPLSYNESLSLLDKLFYYDYNSIIFISSESIYQKKIENINYNNFEELLKKKDKNLIFSYTQKLMKDLKECSATSPSFVKNIYYNLTVRIINFSKSRNINLDMLYQSDDILNYILGFNNIYELDTYLWDQISNLFVLMDKQNIVSEPIHEVIRFINDNFTNPTLSLDEISKNTYLTSSYICVIFKDYTGTTVNKYINELRFNKAKELLQNPEIKMKDIASKIGYSDGNYFAKIFKKETGYNPSDYRRNFCK